MLAHRKRKLIFAHAVLADDSVEGVLLVDYTGVNGVVVVPVVVAVVMNVVAGAIGHLFRRRRETIRVLISSSSLLLLLLLDELGPLDGDGCRGAETDALGEEEVRVSPGVGAGNREVEGVAVGVEDFEGHIGPVDLDR